ncbi:hypothetical protein QLX08_005560 [Tetragonisca angustula]|uniref:Uncharacterized protein n=1 Tax=Tetragonisca angustula TaxID=166442 RepID=A0AAW1A0I8_9HYME
MSRATSPERTTSPSLMDEMRAMREAIAKLAVYTEEENRKRQKEIDDPGRNTLGLVTEDESPAERPLPPRQQSDDDDNTTDEERLSNKAYFNETSRRRNASPNESSRRHESI